MVKEIYVLHQSIHHLLFMLPLHQNNQFTEIETSKLQSTTQIYPLCIPSICAPTLPRFHYLYHDRESQDAFSRRPLELSLLFLKRDETQLTRLLLSSKLEKRHKTSAEFPFRACLYITLTHTLCFQRSGYH